MTTEKCHSVCLLVHDIIVFSPKNKPCELMRQGYVHEVESIPKSLEVNVSFMPFSSPVIGELLCSSTRLKS